MRVITVLIGIVAIIFLTTLSCFACNCAYFTEAQSFEKAEAVFVGRVIDSRDMAVKEGELPKTIFTLHVEKMLKGVDSEEFQIMSSRTDCDAGFSIGWKYMVYAQKFERGYFASACLQTKALQGPSGFLNNPISATLTSVEPWYKNTRKVFFFAIMSISGLLLTGLLIKEMRKPTA
jgi:hypothetical protein